MSDDKLSDKFLLRRGVQYFLLDRKLALKSVILLLIETGISLLGPWIWKISLDDYILQKKTDGLLLISGLYLGLYLLWGFVTYFMLFTLAQLGLNSTYAMRKDTFEHLQELDMNYFDTRKSGDIMSIIGRDIDNMQEWTSVNILYSLSGVVFIIFAFIIMLTISPYLSLISLLILPLIMVVSILSKKWARPAWQRQIKADTEVVSFVNESIQGIKVSQSYANREGNVTQLKELAQNDYLAFNRAFRIDVPLYLLYTTLASLGAVLIYYFGGRLVIEKGISIGELFLFITYQSVYLQHLTRIVDQYSITQSVFSSFERVIGLQELKPGITSGTEKLEMNNDGIVMSNIKFKYRDGPVVFDNFSLKIHSNESLAIVGKTGSGKTSISNILLRLYDFEEGSVSIFSHNITDITLKSLRDNIGYVTQEPILFAGSIRNNIQCNREISDEKIKNALELVGADFVFDKPNQLDFQVGENGNNLSTGQKQLICLARAIATQPPILILDEATASIDQKTEAIITDRLSELLKNRVSIIIAHRISTIRTADRVILLDQGEIIEEGRYSDLLAKQGKFYDLVMTHSK